MAKENYLLSRQHDYFNLSFLPLVIFTNIYLVQNLNSMSIWYYCVVFGSYMISENDKYNFSNYMWISFEELQNDFNNDPSPNKQLFGHILYSLVGTRDGTWKKNMAMYKTLVN